MSSIIDARRANARLPPMNNRFLDDSSDEEEEDEATRLQRQEEEEQERLLSEQFGEASEVSDNNKRKNDKEDIEAEYASAARKKARKRPTLTPAMLTSAKGLVRIHAEFPRQHKWNTKSKTTAAAAVYSRTLVQSYKSFCYDLFPTLNFQDVLTRMESFGSKKEIKDYLQHLRDQVRNGHLEKVYGKEKAASIIAELDEGLKQQEQEDEFGDNTVANNNNNMEGVVPAEAPPPAREYELRRGPFRGPAVEETSGGGAAGTGGEETTAVASTTANESGAVSTSNTTSTTATNSNDKDDLQDSDDELEFVISTKPKPANPFADDDDDDDDEELETEKVATLDEGNKNAAEATTQERQEEDSGMNVDKTKEENETVATVEGATNEKEAPGNESGAAGDDTLVEGAKERESESNEDSPVAMEEEETQLESAAPNDTQEPEDVVEEPTAEQETQEPPSSSDETATVVPTMSESQFDNVSGTQDLLSADSQYASNEPLAQQEEEAATQSSTDETATVVPTMSTQTQSPGSGDEEEVTQD